MRTETNKHMPCFLLPVLEQTLLLPTSAVAEIISYKKSEIEVLPDVPAWFIGILSWRGIQIPVAVLEKMEPYLSWDGITEEQSKLDEQCYMAILNRITKINSSIEVQKFRQYPFFSVVLQGAPKLIWVSNEYLSMCDKTEMIDPRFIMEIKLEENAAFVPNLDGAWKIIDKLPSRLQWLGKIVRRNGG